MTIANIRVTKKSSQPAFGRFVALFAAMLGTASSHVVHAQDATTVTSAMTIPVFESIDENRVDLTNGMLRLQSPLLSAGTGDHQMHAGLEWTGQSWRYIGVPTISRDDDTYIVTYGGVTNEFNDRGSNYSQKKPIDGSSLDCHIWEPGNFATSCVFTNRLGDVVVFSGMSTPQQATFGNYAMQSLGMGNLGMSRAEVYSGNPALLPIGSNDPSFGENVMQGLDLNYNKQTTYLSLYDQQLTINTPNHDGTDEDEHYLRPKSTTQTITNDFGHVWSYTINGDREITQYQMPGGLAPISYTYGGDNRVSSVTTAAGTWTYSFSTSGSSRIANVQTPTGRTYRVTSHKDEGYVTEVRESPGLPSERITTYQYDSGHRLIRVTYDEGNKDEFDYDARGNVIERRVLPKSGSTALIWTADYDGTCTHRVLCNRPNYVIDPEGNRTDFEYADHSTTQVLVPVGGSVVDIRNLDFGHGKPIEVRYPPAVQNGPRKTVKYRYYLGRVDRIWECMTNETCQGTSDEITTELAYTTHEVRVELGTRNVVPQALVTLAQGKMVIPVYKSVTSGGQTLFTCYQYDENARLIGESPPAAELTAGTCPNYFTDPPAYNATTPDTGSAKTAPTFSQ